MAASVSTSSSPSKSAQVRAQLKHPVIDSDGHTVEFQPALRDYIRQVGGAKLAERYKSEGANWYKMTPDQRHAERPLRPPWWALPTKNTLDRATASFPKLQYERLDETGIDFAVLYPTAGLGAPHIRDEELRRASCRAFNTFHADIYREYSDRLTPAAVIPMHTPQEAIDELEYAVKKAGAQGDHDGRSCSSADSYGSRSPAASNAPRLLARTCFALDSEYNYDPVWGEMHGARRRRRASIRRAWDWGSRTSISNYMFNHIWSLRFGWRGNLQGIILRRCDAALPETQVCVLGMWRRMGRQFYCDLIRSLGETQIARDGELQSGQPKTAKCTIELARRYGGKLVEGKLDRQGEGWGLNGTKEDPERLDDWWQCGIEKPGGTSAICSCRISTSDARPTIPSTRWHLIRRSFLSRRGSMRSSAPTWAIGTCPT